MRLLHANLETYNAKVRQKMPTLNTHIMISVIIIVIIIFILSHKTYKYKVIT